MTAAEAEARIMDWFQRGYVLYNTLTDRSTRIRPAVCPNDGASLRVNGIEFLCSKGCGWSYVIPQP